MQPHTVHTPTLLHATHTGIADQLHDLLSHNVNVTTWGRRVVGGRRGEGLDGVMGRKEGERRMERKSGTISLSYLPPHHLQPLSSFLPCQMSRVMCAHTRTHTHKYSMHVCTHTPTYASLPYDIRAHPSASPWVVT